MARIRSVKPEICESETMARLSAEVERTFVRLWTHLDDQGRAKDNPHLIVAALFPLHDDVTAAVVDVHLAALAAEGLIVRYEVDGTRYLACPSWSEHQHPQKPRPSKIPAPPVGVPDVSRTPTVAVPEQSGPVVGGVEVEGGGVVEGDVEDSTKSQDYSQPDPQTLAKAAALVARQIASTNADRSPGGLAAAIATRINNLDVPDDDRDRIVAALAAGQTPEEIAAGWDAAKPDWLTYAGSARTEPAPPRPPLRPFSLAAHEAEAEAQRAILEAQAAAS